MRQAFIIFLVLGSAYSSFAQREVTFGGNKFSMSRVDTVPVTDPVTGIEELAIMPSRPVRMNGAPIYATEALNNFPFFKTSADGSEKLSGYLFNNLKKDLDSLEEGEYILLVTNIVIDHKGKLVYYEFGGIQKLVRKTVFTTAMPGKSISSMERVADHMIKDTSASATIPPGESAGGIDINATAGIEANAFSRVETTQTDTGIDLRSKNIINTAAQELLDNLPRMKPAQLKGVNVNCTGTLFSSWNYIIVRDHKALFTPYPDCL